MTRVIRAGSFFAVCYLYYVHMYLLSACCALLVGFAVFVVFIVFSLFTLSAARSPFSSLRLHHSRAWADSGRWAVGRRWEVGNVIVRRRIEYIISTSVNMCCIFLYLGDHIVR
jgi:hypothetical protein